MHRHKRFRIQAQTFQEYSQASKLSANTCQQTYQRSHTTTLTLRSHSDRFHNIRQQQGTCTLRILRKINSQNYTKMLQLECQHLHRVSKTCSNLGQSICREHVQHLRKPEFSEAQRCFSTSANNISLHRHVPTYQRMSARNMYKQK